MVMQRVCRCSIDYSGVSFADSFLVGRIAQYAVNHSQTLSSLLGQNVVYCMRRYNCSLHELLDGSVGNIVKSFVFNSFDDNMRCSASFFVWINNDQEQSVTHEPIQIQWFFFAWWTAALNWLRLYELVSARPFDLFCFYVYLWWLSTSYVIHIINNNILSPKIAANSQMPEAGSSIPEACYFRHRVYSVCRTEKFIRWNIALCQTLLQSLKEFCKKSINS